MIRILVPLFEQGGVPLSLAGHEDDFRLSRVGDVLYVVSGAGGKLREEPPREFTAPRTEWWCLQAHAPLVELADDEARITPVSGAGRTRLDRAGRGRPRGVPLGGRAARR